MTIDKTWAENQIRHNRNSFIVALGACSLLNSDATLGLHDEVVVCKDGELIFHPNPDDRIGRRHEVPLGQLAHDYQSKRPDFMASLREFYKSARRQAFKESFAIVDAYADTLPDSGVLKEQDWYQYARMIRNSISHNFHLRFNSYDRLVLPVSWHGVTIDGAMDGTHLSEDLVPPDVLLDLLIEIECFIHKN